MLAIEMSTCTYLTCKVAGDSSSHRGTGTIGLFEAAAPFACVNRAILVQIAGVNEGLDAAFVLIVLQIVQLLQRQQSIVVQIQMPEHPLGLGLAGRWEMRLRLLAMLATLLAVGHDHGEPVQQTIANGGQLLWLALGRLQRIA